MRRMVAKAMRMVMVSEVGRCNYDDIQTNFKLVRKMSNSTNKNHETNSTKKHEWLLNVSS